MNKKILWFVAFLVVAALSCFATAKSFMLIIDLPWYIIVPMTIVFFVFSSYAFKLIMDAVHNDGTVENPKAKLWGGITLLLLTWVMISLPTNAHTFFFMKGIGEEVSSDIDKTLTYARQLADRKHLDIEREEVYNNLVKNCTKEFSNFSNEVKGNNGKSGFGDRANTHINKINEYLSTEGAQYSIATVPNTNRSSDAANTALIENKKQEMQAQLTKIEDINYKVDKRVAAEIRSKDIPYLTTIDDSITLFIQMGTLWRQEAYLKQAQGTLSQTYSKIKSNYRYVRFNPQTDEDIYTAEHLETRTAHFLNPYKVMGDFFTGKLSFTFIFWIILSILLDVIGFISFDLALKKEYDF